MRELVGAAALFVTGSSSPTWLASLAAFAITFLVLYSRLRREPHSERIHYDR